MACASTADPTWVMTCSVRLPSVAAKVFHSRCAAYDDSVKPMPLTALAAWSAARRSAIFVSSGTVNGSWATGVSYVPWAGGRSSRRVRSLSAVALARAIRTASAATRSASAAVRMCDEAKPHAPSTRTRTPNPSLSPDATPSTRPLLMAMLSSSRRTTRASAYPAPWADAVSSARSVRSDMPAETSRGRSDGHSGVCPSRGPRSGTALRAPGRRSEDGGTGDGLHGQVDAQPEDEDGCRERDQTTGSPERGGGVDAIEATSGEDEREPDAAHDEGHPEPERDDEQEPEGRSAGRDRAEEDQERAGRRDQAAGQAEDEQAPP